MKVDHNGLGIPTARSGETSRTADTSPLATGRPQGRAREDRFTLSSDAQVVQSAITQAANHPEIREELVTRMRDLLDHGELGQDASRLADAIIDRWLTTP